MRAWSGAQVKLRLERNLSTLVRLITKVYSKSKKPPVQWSSKILFSYNRNAILGQLHRAIKIASNLGKELKKIKTKYLQTWLPMNVINYVIRRFNQEKDDVAMQQ